MKETVDADCVSKDVSCKILCMKVKYRPGLPFALTQIMTF